MGWWSRRRSATSTKPAEKRCEAVKVSELTLEEQIVATSNVMAVRDAVAVLLVAIQEHRSNGHECAAYCTSSQFDQLLEMMDRDDFVMIVTVVLNDMVDNWLRQRDPQ